MEENGSVTVDLLMEKDSLTREDVQQLRKLVYGSEKNRTILKKALDKLDADASAKRNYAKAYRLALAYWFTDRDDEALDLLRRHLKSEDAYITYVSWCIIKERFAEAHETAAKGLKQYKGNARLELLGAQAAVKAGIIKEGEKVSRKYEKALPSLDLEALRNKAEEAEQAEEVESGEETEDVQEDAAEQPRHQHPLLLPLAELRKHLERQLGGPHLLEGP